MTFEKFRQIIDDLNPIYLNMGPSGEALLNPHFFEMVGYAKQKGITVIVSTNGTVLANGDIAERLVRCGLDILKISIDAADKEVYRAIRRQDSFDRILEGIDAVYRAKQRFKARCPSLRFDAVVMKENYCQLTEMLALARQKSIDHAFFRPLNYAGFSQDNIRDLIGSFGKMDLKRELARAYEFAVANGLKTNLKWFMDNIDGVLSLYDPKDQGDTIRKRRKPVCLLPWVSILVDVKGRVGYCCRLSVLDSLRDKSGFFKEGAISSLFCGKGFEKIRRLHANKGNYRMDEICDQCLEPVSLSAGLDIINLFPKKKKA